MKCNKFLIKKVIQKIMALFVILVLSNFIMSTRVYAEYAASSQDTAKDSTSDTSSSGDFEDTESDNDIFESYSHHLLHCLLELQME